jgi:3-hydroxybutyryl-CoA dehydratase
MMIDQPWSPADLRGKAATMSRTIAESDVYLFGGITGDLAAYHVDEAAMRRTDLGRRVAHGVLLLGLGSAVSSTFWTTYSGDGRTISYGYDRVRFVKPVFIGDTVTVRYELTDYDAPARKTFATITATNEHDDVVLSAVHITKVGDL